MQLLVRALGGQSLVVQVSGSGGKPTVEDLRASLQAQHAGRTSRGGVLLYRSRRLLDGVELSACGVTDGSTIIQTAGLLGGKGGFGAMLRGAGRTGKLTDNFDACRDLNGRRVRHQEAERKLAEWAAQEKERELEKVAQQHIKQQLKEERHLQLEKINEEIVKEVSKQGIKGVKEAVASGLQLAAQNSKRKNPDTGASGSKKQKGLKVWGLDELDSDSDDSDVEGEAAATAPTPSNTPAKPTEEAGPSVSAETPAESSNPKSSGALAADEPATAQSESVDLKSYSSAKALKALGLDTLKTELQRYGLKHGGNINQRAERLFLVRDTPLDKIDSKHFAKK